MTHLTPASAAPSQDAETAQSARVPGVIDVWVPLTYTRDLTRRQTRTVGVLALIVPDSGDDSQPTRRLRLLGISPKRLDSPEPLLPISDVDADLSAIDFVASAENYVLWAEHWHRTLLGATGPLMASEIAWRPGDNYAFGAVHNHTGMAARDLDSLFDNLVGR